MATELKAPIFLLGNVRSGTTMIQDLFGLHPEVVTWFEPRTIWMYADPGRPHDRFDASDAKPAVVKYIRMRFLDYQRQHGGLRIMEKTPSNVLRVPYMNAIFPEAKYVYIVREPLAYLSSSELKWRREISWAKLRKRIAEVPKSQLHYYAWRYFVDKFRKKVLRRKYVSVWGVRYPGIYDDLKDDPIETIIARQWAFASEQVERDLDELDPHLVLRVRYEDFVLNPVEEFRRILAHFGLGSSLRIDEAVRNTVDKDRQNKWKRLKPGSLAPCLPILQPEMERHGYTIPEEFREAFEDLPSPHVA